MVTSFHFNKPDSELPNIKFKEEFFLSCQERKTTTREVDRENFKGYCLHTEIQLSRVSLIRYCFRTKPLIRVLHSGSLPTAHMSKRSWAPSIHLLARQSPDANPTVCLTASLSAQQLLVRALFRIKNAFWYHLREDETTLSSPLPQGRQLSCGIHKTGSPFPEGTFTKLPKGCSNNSQDQPALGRPLPLRLCDHLPLESLLLHQLGS